MTKLVFPLALAVTVLLQAVEPHWRVMEYDDLREGQLEAAGAVVMTLIGGLLLGRARRDRSRQSLLPASRTGAELTPGAAG